MAKAVEDECRGQLENERAELQQAIDDLSGPDASDGGDAREADSLTETLRETLKDIEDALAKLANGSFGTCEMCKGRIADERLREMPAARLCFACADAQSSVISSSADVD